MLKNIFDWFIGFEQIDRWILIVLLFFSAAGAASIIKYLAEKRNKTKDVSEGE